MLLDDGLSVDYEYDAFGRAIRDGGLTYDYDDNGNRLTVGYPGGATATYGYDFADSYETLEVQVGADPPRSVASAAGYLPSGPLTSLTLGNGAVEARLSDSRYHPDSIDVAGARSRTWDYQTDTVGNITRIDDVLTCGSTDLVLSGETVAMLRVEVDADLGMPVVSSRTFGYQDFQLSRSPRAPTSSTSRATTKAASPGSSASAAPQRCATTGATSSNGPTKAQQERSDN